MSSATVGPGSVHGPGDRFLTAAERGNPSTAIDAGCEPAGWTVGDRVRRTGFHHQKLVLLRLGQRDEQVARGIARAPRRRRQPTHQCLTVAT